MVAGSGAPDGGVPVGASEAAEAVEPEVLGVVVVPVTAEAIPAPPRVTPASRALDTITLRSRLGLRIMDCSLMYFTRWILGCTHPGA
jgi:hypothetical protein